MTEFLIQVALPIYNLTNFDYLCKHKVEVGNIITIPFRSKEITAVVWGFKEHNISPYKLKEVISVSEFPALSSSLIEYIRCAAEYNIAAIGSILKMVIPNSDIIKPSLRIKDDYNHQFLKMNFPPLSENQKNAANMILQSKKVSVLDGITGSGKSEVYLSVCKHILETKPKSQILILLPEIALTTQIIDRIKERFGVKAACWHSSQTAAQKRKIWQDIISNKARLIVGARSALFLPYANLSLIIVDEEHDQSYKQEELVTYNARDMAVLRAHIENIPIILASATPSIETEENIRSGKYNRIALFSRFGGASLPKLTIIDMKKEKKSNNKFLSPSLIKEIHDVLHNNKQVLLFMNRRGYAPLNICNSCSYRIMCPTCSSWLVEHKKYNKLICHHCSFNMSVPNQCPNCNSNESFVACGPGVERIEEEVKEYFPNKETTIITQDTMHNPKLSSLLINRIINNEIQIIIGTQLIAKGHHFPNLELVGVLDVDLGLNGGDLRAVEKTYQLLQQVGGRAGRESSNGHVMIQSYCPENIVIQSLTNMNRNEFIEHELQIRKDSSLPPFTKLTMINLSGLVEEVVFSSAQKLVKFAPLCKSLKILGPTPSVLSRLRGRYRYSILLNYNKKFNIKSYVEQWFESVKIPSTIKVKIDIDPYNFC